MLEEKRPADGGLSTHYVEKYLFFFFALKLPPANSMWYSHSCFGRGKEPSVSFHLFLFPYDCSDFCQSLPTVVTFQTE